MPSSYFQNFTVFALRRDLFYSQQDLCDEWAKKPKDKQTFEDFHRAVKAAAFHQYGRTKYKVNTYIAVSESVKPP